MDYKQLEKALEGTTDGQFIDIMYEVTQILYGITAPEFILEKAKKNKKIQDLLKEYIVNEEN